VRQFLDRSKGQSLADGRTRRTVCRHWADIVFPVYLESCRFYVRRPGWW